VRVVRSGHFERQVAAELDIEGRPSVEQFEDQLAPIAELVFSTFWEDPTLVPTVDDETGIRITLIAPPAPYMFPPFSLLRSTGGRRDDRDDWCRLPMGLLGSGRGGSVRARLHTS
jgi:hypothetical protein